MCFNIKWVRSAVLLCVALLALSAAPLAAQDTPTSEGDALTMEEAERVIGGLEAALYKADLDAAMAFFADEFEYVSTGWEDEPTIDTDIEVIRASYLGWLNDHGCRSLIVVTGVDGSTAHAIDMWTCIPQPEESWNALVPLEVTIADGKIVRYEEYILQENFDRWSAEMALQADLGRFTRAFASTRADAFDDILADDVSLSVIVDPLTGEVVEIAGKEAVIAALSAWKEAGMKYLASGWAERGTTMMVHGRLQWPEWKEMIGVALRTDDRITFDEGKVTEIVIRTAPDMIIEYGRRQREANP